MKVFSKTADKRLWSDFIAGDDDALKAIYNGYVQVLFNFGKHFTRNYDLIQDCIQDLFVDLHKYRKQLKLTENIGPYLFVSLKRKIFRELNVEGKYTRISFENVPFFYSLAENDADDEINARRHELLEKAMDALTDRQREAVYLRFVNGLTYDEISEVLQMNYQSARNLIHRAIGKLKSSLEAESLILFYTIHCAKFNYSV